MKSVCIKSLGGSMRIYASSEGVTQIDCLAIDSPPEATDDPILLQAIAELQQYFEGQRQTFDVPIDLKIGTAFQREAWATLRKIPYGQTMSYGEQAKAMGRPKAMRAVGAANGRNPLPVIIPCHRVISSLGKLHGFSGGIELKKTLLAIEGLMISS